MRSDTQTHMHTRSHSFQLVVRGVLDVVVIGNVMVIVGSAGSFFPVNSGPVYHPKTSCVGEWVGGHINRYNHGREGASFCGTNETD